MEEEKQKQAQNQPAVAETPLARFNKSIMNAKTQDYLQSVLSSKKAQFVNNITALVANDAKLQQCTPMSLIYAGIKATALDLPLDPNLGCAYVIPYKNTKSQITEAQFQLGYKGFIQLAIRSRQFSCINVTDVRQGELKNYDLLSGEVSVQAVPNRSELPVIGYVAYFRLNNGGSIADCFAKSLYMTVDEIQQHAKTYSQTYSSSKDYIRNSSKWTTDFDAMAKKTVLKLLLSRYAPMSVEMQQIQDAVRSDQAVIGESGQPAAYIDNATVSEAEEVTAEDYEDLVNERKEAMRQSENKAPEMP